MTDELSLLDWRRLSAELYGEIRATPDKQAAWELWHATRARLFREHPQSPVPEAQRAGYTGPHLYDYDPSWCLTASVEEIKPRRLELYWLDGYGGGLFLPFADATSGDETYGAGRYLLDTVKGADLGQYDGRLVLDFNFAYQPSCAYDPRWTCPLAPPANRLSVAVRAGERIQMLPSPSLGPP